MVRRRRLTDQQVIALPIRSKRYFHLDPELNGMYVRVAETGTKTFVCVARDPRNGKQKWVTIGGTDLWKIDAAREEARSIIKRIQKGLDAREPMPVQPESYKAVADNWIKRHVIEDKKLISRSEIERVLTKIHLPEIRPAQFRRDQTVGRCRAAGQDR